MLTTPCKPSHFSCVFRTTWNGFLQICSVGSRFPVWVAAGVFPPYGQDSAFLLVELCALFLQPDPVLSALPLRIYAVWNHLQTQWECPQPPSPASDRDVKQTGSCKDPLFCFQARLSYPNLNTKLMSDMVSEALLKFTAWSKELWMEFGNIFILYWGHIAVSHPTVWMTFCACILCERPYLIVWLSPEEFRIWTGFCITR